MVAASRRRRRWALLLLDERRDGDCDRRTPVALTPFRRRRRRRPARHFCHTSARFFFRGLRRGQLITVLDFLHESDKLPKGTWFTHVKQNTHGQKRCISKSWVCNKKLHTQVVIMLTSSGISLNYLQLVGPVVQSDLFYMWCALKRKWYKKYNQLWIVVQFMWVAYL